MDDQDHEFTECLEVFAQHDYERAANLSLNLLGKRMFLWVMQVLLISLERDGQHEALRAMSELAMSSFSHNALAIALIQLNLGRLSMDKISVKDLDERQALQLAFYTASRHLTLGDRDSALPGLKRCAASDVRYPEQFLAARELEHPEPADLILQRLAQQISAPDTGGPGYDLCTAARSAVQVLSREPVFDHSLVLPLLEILTIRLGRMQPSPTVQLSSQIGALYGLADKSWPAPVEAAALKAALDNQPPIDAALETDTATHDHRPAGTTPSGLPLAFVNSLITTIPAVMNNPNVREAIDAIEPRASNAARQYANVFAWAIPSLPPLSDENIAEIASALKASIRTEDGPLNIPDREVFTFLSQAFSRALGKNRPPR
jgi:hypothetical protein